MICAKTSLPWFIGGPRDGRHHGLANAPIRVEIETRSKHELSFTNQTVIAPLVLDVGTALRSREYKVWIRASSSSSIVAHRLFPSCSTLCALRKGGAKLYGFLQ